MMSQRRVGMKAHIEVQARAEKAEALAADHENQIAELCMGLDQAEGRVAELEGAAGRLADAFKMITDAKPDDMGSAEQWAEIEGAYKSVREALSGDGSRIMDVVKAARIARGILPIQRNPHDDDALQRLVNLAMSDIGEALDRMDGKEPTP